jgi:hypothetical protein
MASRERKQKRIVLASSDKTKQNSANSGKCAFEENGKGTSGIKLQVMAVP